MGIDPKSPENMEENLVSAAIISSNIDVLKLLIKNGYPYQSIKNKRPLLYSIVFKSIDAVKFFYEMGEKIKAEDLEFACNSCHGILEFLLDHISDEELNSPVNGSYAVHWICRTKSPQIVESVLNRGININLLDKNGRSGLHYLSEAKSETDLIKIFELFVQSGFDINIKCVDQNGKEVNSVLAEHLFAINLRLKLIEWLLRHGARTDVKIPNRGMTIIEYINKQSNRKLKQLFDNYNT
ncbi:hypothetical protein M9Y10_007696 [Tritrichomonas musculus]|uniref:Ankyrin repeat protein n=1 Tax=Tritrichomonas musculus TaxID=1915356 RepID=A0ABR2J2Y7_9EUKA